MVSVSERCIGFDGVTTWLLVERTTAAMLVWGPATPFRKTLGAAGVIVTLKLSLTPPGVLNCSVVLPSTENGSWALICRGDTYITGTGTPFTVRQLSPR